MAVRLTRLLLYVLGLSATLVAQPHPQVSYNLRAAHFEHHAGGMTAYFRLSMPLVVGGRLGARRSDGAFAPAPYTYNRVESGQVFHYLDIASVRKNAFGLGQFVAAGHEIVADGERVNPKVLSVRVHPRGAVPPFSSLTEAKAAANGAHYPALDDEIDTGYVMVDAVIAYSTGAPIRAFSIRSSLVPGELGEPRTRNVFWDHRAAGSYAYDANGLLEAPFAIDPVAAPGIMLPTAR